MQGRSIAVQLLLAKAGGFRDWPRVSALSLVGLAWLLQVLMMPPRAVWHLAEDAGLRSKPLVLCSVRSVVLGLVAGRRKT